MTDESIVRVDAKGRVTLPKAIRDELNIQDGTPFFVKFIKGKGVVILAPAINPFDILAEQAIEEYKAGKTTNIEEYAKSL
ncbi:MAG TPA: AbrB/MazE/SpoVT family DNA-binding domain-containing protein [Fervidobacterium sp.]|nr:AbrB/MazE/SpoVT family DNA-binding domain-containing protein [Fervidobacterium sp.]